MALTLDPRQRAMLQEMGITLWMPAVPAAALPPAAAPIVAPMTTAASAVAKEAPVHTPASAVPVALATPSASPSAAATAIPPAPPSTATAPAHSAAASAVWQMAAAIQAYPQATGGHAEDGWLVIWECAHPHAPLEGDSGKLLNNMLRALRLHHSPHVWIAGLQRPGYEALPVAGIAAAPVDWQDLPSALSASVAQARPARILVLGLQAARAVLGSQEALGRLRAQVHHVQNIPAVVSYDPAYLLRSPHAKPAAWADLCRAHALRPPSAA